MEKSSTSKANKTEWNGILLTDDFYEQKENRLYTIIVKAVIVYLLTMGSLGCILSCIGTAYYKPVVYIAVFLEALLCASLYYRKLWENIGYLLILIVVIIIGVSFPDTIRTGVYALLNDMSETASSFFDTNAMKTYAEYIDNRKYAVTFSMCFIAGVFTVLVNILISRRMKYIFTAFIAVCFLAFPLYIGLEPDIIPMTMFIAGAIASMALKRAGHYDVTDNNTEYRIDKKKRIKYTLSWKVMAQLCGIMLICVLILAVIVDIVLPKRKFHDMNPDSSFKENTKEYVQNFYMMGISSLFNQYQNTGGLTSGRLGGINSVRLDYNTDLTVKFVPHNTERVYLKSFIGDEYLPYENQWKRDSAIVKKDINAKAYKKSFDKKDKKTAKAVMEVENVDAAIGMYLPYYTSDFDKIVNVGETQDYEYYPEFADNGIKVPDIISRSEKYKKSRKKYDDDVNYMFTMYSVMQQYLRISDENRKTVNDFCDKAGLKATASLKEKDVTEVVNELSEYYQKNIPYTYQPGATPYKKDFINYFLNENKRGYCAHFASAATLIFRNLGIPARYVEGYAIDLNSSDEDVESLPKEDTKQYYNGYNELKNSGVVSVNVTDADAHAWVEVYVKNKGWQVVDVTPYSDEEPDTGGILGMFMRFIGQNGRQLARQNQSTGVDTKKMQNATRDVSLSILTALIATAAIVLFIRYVVKCLIYTVRYFRADINKRLLIKYNRYVQKIGHRNKGIRECINFREQIEWLTDNELIHLQEKDRIKLIQLLEQAAFSNKTIGRDDAGWVVQKIKRKN